MQWIVRLRGSLMVLCIEQLYIRLVVFCLLLLDYITFQSASCQTLSYLSIYLQYITGTLYIRTYDNRIHKNCTPCAKFLYTNGLNLVFLYDIRSQQPLVPEA